MTPLNNTPPNIIKATALNITWLKDSARNSADCLYTATVREGETIELNYCQLFNEVNHYQFVVHPRKNTQTHAGHSAWWAYAPHWKIEGTERGNNPTESQGTNAATPPAPATPAVEVKPKKTYKIPGISTPIARSQPIYAGSNFTWDEALWGDATGDRIRMPESAAITENIVKLAKYMDAVRRDLGNRPIKVTSWYRDSATNKAVRGATWSQHLQGLAIDFHIPGEDVVTTFNKLKSFRNGTLSLAVGNGFVHLDLRPGGPARWRYPGGPYVALW